MSGESYLVGVIAFLIFMAIFLTLQQLPLKVGWLLLEISTGLIVHILFSFAGGLMVEGFSYWYQASLYAFLWFCFFFVSSIYSASVSVGIISHLYKQLDHTASLSDVYQNCVVRVFEERVDFLIATNQVQKTKYGYISTRPGNRTADRLQLINRVLGMESQGFYSSTSSLAENENKVSDK